MEACKLLQGLIAMLRVKVGNNYFLKTNVNVTNRKFNSPASVETML
jgi:hypothetical protein